MKWFLLLLIFIAGIYYLANRHKTDLNQQAAAERIKQDLIKTTEEPALPLKPEKVYTIKLSMQTLSTLRALTYDPNEKVRVASAELLWQLQDDQAAPIIKKIFQEETDDSVKKDLIGILVKDKSKLSLALLAEAMSADDKQTRLRAVDAIGTFSNKEAILVLNKGLSDYDADIRLKALEAVNRIRTNIEAHKEQQLRELKDTEPLFKVE